MQAYAFSNLRLAEAKLVHAEARLAILASVQVMGGPQTVPQKVGHLSNPADITRQLATVSKHGFEAYSYVTALTQLVYATTLFDTFLQDVIEFALFMHPRAVGDSTILLSAVIEASGWATVINDAIRKKVRELGFLSFPERIKWLKTKFGLTPDISAEAMTQIAHYADLRNAVVHDQGFLEFGFTDNRKLALFQAKCPVHPTPVTIDQSNNALQAYNIAAVALTNSVYRELLKCAVPSDVGEPMGKLLMDDRATK